MMAHSAGVMGPKKLCGWVVHRPGPLAENRSTQSIKRLCSSSNCRSSFLIRLFSVGIFRRIGSSLNTDFFAILPKIRPAKLRGGELNPAATSSHAEQCDIICATFIAPHCFWLSGLRRSIRFLISITEDASNRFFTDFSPPAPSHRLLTTIRFSSLSRNSTVVASRVALHRLREMRRALRSYGCTGRSLRIIQLMPNRSCTWPKREAKNVSWIGIRTRPPSERAAKTRSASTSLSIRSVR